MRWEGPRIKQLCTHTEYKNQQCLQFSIPFTHQFCNSLKMPLTDGKTRKGGGGKGIPKLHIWLLDLFFLASSCSLRDVSSLTRYGTQAHGSESAES